MEKITKRIKLEYPLNWMYGIEISKIREDLDELEQIGATHIEIESYESYGSAFTTIEAVCERIETDEECAKRLLEHEYKKDEIRQRELVEFERLKSKYGK
jgi:hypothetical protein